MVTTGTYISKDKEYLYVYNTKTDEIKLYALNKKGLLSYVYEIHEAMFRQDEMGYYNYHNPNENVEFDPNNKGKQKEL